MDNPPPRHRNIDRKERGSLLWSAAPHVCSTRPCWHDWHSNGRPGVYPTLGLLRFQAPIDLLWTQHHTKAHVFKGMVMHQLQKAWDANSWLQVRLSGIQLSSGKVPIASTSNVSWADVMRGTQQTQPQVLVDSSRLHTCGDSLYWTC